MRGFWRKHHGGIGIALAFFLLGAILFLTVRIQNITVTGSDRYTADELEELLFSEPWGRNSAAAYLKDRLKPHRQIPFVEDYRIVFHSPFDVEIIVYEKSIVGYVSYMSSCMYFDRDGIIVESSSEKLEGVPWITGLDFGQIVLYKPLPVEDPDIFQEILNLTQQLSLYGIPVDRIEYDSQGQAVLYICRMYRTACPCEYDSQGQAVLYIRQMEVTLGDNRDIDGKISTLHDILTDQPQLMDERGVLMLENYTEANSHVGITFKRK